MLRSIIEKIVTQWRLLYVGRFFIEESQQLGGRNTWPVSGGQDEQVLIRNLRLHSVIIAYHPSQGEMDHSLWMPRKESRLVDIALRSP